METSGRPAGGGVSLRPAVFRKENLLWNLDVWGTASGGHGQAEVRDDTTSASRDPVAEALPRDASTSHLSSAARTAMAAKGSATGMRGTRRSVAAGTLGL